MLEFLHGKASDRKLRLCAVAWARSFVRHAQGTATSRMVQYAGWLTDARWSNQLEAAEQYADGRIGRAAVREARLASGGPYNVFLAATRVTGFSITHAHHSLSSCQLEFGVPTKTEVCALIRDIVGNPFCSVTLDPFWLGWNDGTVRKLAQVIYDGRAFDHLPLLADALEEAGCTNAAILAHCREPDEHVRGCWVVDLLLGKQ